MTKKIDYISLFARLALAIGFLSAVADRLGLWTPLLGSENVVWGNMESFTAYTGVLLPWIPQISNTIIGMDGYHSRNDSRYIAINRFPETLGHSS